jgi:hypothetical protein
MPVSNVIKCPNCGHEFAAEKAIFQQAEQKFKLEFEHKIAEQNNLFQSQQEMLLLEKNKLIKEREEQERILKEKVNAEINKITQTAEAKIKEEYELEMAALISENDKRKEENRQLKQKELELLQKEEALLEKAEEQNLEFERKIKESRERIAQDFERKISEKEVNFKMQQELLEIEKNQLMKAKAEQEKMIQEKLLDEKKKLTQTVEAKVKEEYELEMAALISENNKRKEENKQLKQKELELLQKEKALLEKADEMELEIEHRILQNRENLALEIQNKEHEKTELKFREYEKKLDDQKKLIDEMKRKSEQGSMQLQGEIQELALEEHLRQKFPFDLIEEVAKGVKGADIIQTVKNNRQQICGKIIYESKRTKAFNEEWIEKLKNDQLSQKADLAVIVTEIMPKDMLRFGLKDGVWICSYPELDGVALVLREMLIKMEYLKVSEENKSDKMAMLYGYLVSSEFQQQMSAIVEGFQQMQEDLEKEKRAMTAQWKKREKQIEKVIYSTVEMYGSVRGIAGNAIAPIPLLELPELE